MMLKCVAMATSQILTKCWGDGAIGCFSILRKNICFRIGTWLELDLEHFSLFGCQLSDSADLTEL